MSAAIGDKDHKTTPTPDTRLTPGTDTAADKTYRETETTRTTMPARVLDPPETIASQMAKVSLTDHDGDDHNGHCDRHRRKKGHSPKRSSKSPRRDKGKERSSNHKKDNHNDDSINSSSHHSRSSRGSRKSKDKSRSSSTRSESPSSSNHSRSSKPSSHRSRARSPASEKSSNERLTSSPEQPGLKPGIMKDPRRQSTKNSRLSSSLQFADYDCVFEIPHINDFPPEVVRDVYMSSEELSAIRKECIGTVKCMNDTEGGSVDHYKEGQFLRGLDQHTLKYTERKKGIDRRVYEAVFRIQEFERSTGVDASEIMAKHCAINSEPSVAAAHIAAISDVFSAFKGTWSERSIPNPQACSSNPTQGTFE